MDKKETPDTEKRSHSTSQKQIQSPYAGWFQPRQLQDEIDRLRKLPPTDNVTITRWRINRIWQIEQRLKELYKRNT